MFTFDVFVSPPIAAGRSSAEEIKAREIREAYVPPAYGGCSRAIDVWLVPLSDAIQVAAAAAAAVSHMERFEDGLEEADASFHALFAPLLLFLPAARVL